MRVDPIRDWRRPVVVLVALAVVASACSEGGEVAGGEASGGGAVAQPEAGTWRTWVISSGSEVMVPPPPMEGSIQERAEDEEIRELAEGRTPEVVDIVRRWAGEGEPVSTPWVEMNLEFVSARAKDPPLASRGYALMSVAVYDAMVSAYHWKYTYNRDAPDVADHLTSAGPDPSYPSEHAAIAGAASEVLAYLFPERPALRLREAADQAGESRIFAGTSRRSDVEAGLALGREVAARVIAHAESDGAGDPCDREVPGPEPRWWAPPPGSVANPVQPCAGDWKPWVMTSGDQFRPGPPPVFGSEEFLANIDAVIEAKENLTEAQERAATFWAGGEGTPLPPGVWMQVALAYLRSEKPATPVAERALALASVAMSDAGVAAWDAKYAYWDPRPQNGVRNAGVDPDWVPFIETPFFPSYVSGHATYSGAAAEVLAFLFPDDEADFRAKADEAAMSRLWGGIHWPTDNTVGLAMGEEIGALVTRWAAADMSAGG